MDKIGLIPCAGRGSRLSLPFSKELFPNVHTLAYSPIILYTINAMKSAGIKHFVITINPQKMDIVKFLGNGKKFGVSIYYCVHPEPRSLPQSLDEAYNLLKNKTVVFAMPDTFIKPSNYLQLLLNTHENDQKSEVTLACFQTKNPSKFGMVDFSEDTENVISILDKPLSTNLKWMWGAMVWSPEFTEALHQFVINKSDEDSSEKELVLSDALLPLIERNKVKAYCFPDGTYMDLGTYNEIQEWSKGE
ncbi:sugar phosphate nucleotidyltransferase [Bacillus sp. CGMCC 1.16607]|uniref:sugar phosphate nucleotidyltransferase n=1 Tax=Bacillus sp. CGMCC 1.16607 TaxID=3351842 RepID=UPI00362CC3B7